MKFYKTLHQDLNILQEEFYYYPTYSLKADEASGMFAYLTNIEKLDLSKLDTSYITNTSKMFYMSSGLKTMANYTIGYLTYKSNN